MPPRSDAASQIHVNLLLGFDLFVLRFRFFPFLRECWKAHDHAHQELLLWVKLVWGPEIWKQSSANPFGEPTSDNVWTYLIDAAWSLSSYSKLGSLGPWYVSKAEESPSTGSRMWLIITISASNLPDVEWATPDSPLITKQQQTDKRVLRGSERTSEKLWKQQYRHPCTSRATKDFGKLQRDIHSVKIRYCEGPKTHNQLNATSYKEISVCTILQGTALCL